MRSKLNPVPKIFFTAIARSQWWMVILLMGFGMIIQFVDPRK
jgi:hypothetical protein